MAARSSLRLSDSQRSSLLVVGLSFAAFVVLGLPGGLLGVAWPSIRAQFSLSQDQVGALLLAAQIGYITSSFLSGRMILRFGNGQVLALGAALACVGLFGYAIAPFWLFMVAIGILSGFGGGALDSAMNAFFAMNYGPRLMNWLHASFGLGSTFGPILLTVVLVAGASWRWGYVAAGVAQGIIMLAFLLTLSRWGGRSAEEEVKSPIPAAQTEEAAEASPLDVGLSILVFFFIAGLEMSAGQWSFALFTESRGTDLASAGFWVSVYWGSFTAGRIFFGIIGNRIRMLTALRASMIAMLVASLMIWQQGSDLVSFAGLALMGFAIAPLFPLLMTATPVRLGRRRAANAIGYQVGAASLGIAILPWLAGFLAEQGSLEVVGPFLLVGSAIMLVLHEVLEARRPMN
ncbi:MAG: MFS transporter [Caldilineaceae bacterium]|nr:MFS transporter [Caldilineaceae bacterium]